MTRDQLIAALKLLPEGAMIFVPNAGGAMEPVSLVRRVTTFDGPFGMTTAMVVGDSMVAVAEKVAGG